MSIERDALVGNLLDRIDALERAVRRLDDTHPGAPGEAAGKLAYYRVADGSLRAPGDLHADGDAYGLWSRYVNRYGGLYTDHFRSGVIPTGWAWVNGGGFNGTPTALSYSWKGSFLQVRSTSTPHLLAKTIATYSNKVFVARMRCSQLGEIGLRVDDGSDDNYAEMILDPNDLGAYNVDFRFRAGGGAVTDNAGPLYPCTEFVVVRLSHSAATPLMLGCTVGAEGDLVSINGFNTGAIAWTPARVGIKVQVDTTGYSFVDWFYCDFA